MWLVAVCVRFCVLCGVTVTVILDPSPTAHLSIQLVDPSANPRCFHSSTTAKRVFSLQLSQGRSRVVVLVSALFNAICHAIVVVEP